MTMGYPDTFKESFYESGCIIQQCCIIAPFFDTSPAIPPDKCLVVYSTSLSCPCRQASNAVGPTITVTNRGSFVGLVNSTLFSTSVVGFWGRELHTVEWKQWKEMWWNGKTLFSCMFIFSRDFSHPRQKISAKWQPFSTSKVHFKHSPIRQKNYKMSNTFLQNFKVCDINLLPPCNTLHLQKWVFFGGFWQPPTGSPKKKKPTIQRKAPLQRSNLAPQLRGRASAIGVLPTAHPFATNFQLTTSSAPTAALDGMEGCCWWWNTPRFREISSVRNGWWLNRLLWMKFMCCLSNLFRKLP